MSYDYLFKYIIIGNSGVGKSCTLLQFTDNEFQNSHEVTIGVEFGTQTIELENKEKKIIKIQIWDTAGQECFRSITRSYYRGAAVAILIYDITNSKSFKDISNWLKELLLNSENKMTIAIVGNKSDLSDKRQVSRKEAQEFAEENGCMFIETSAKDSTNINKLFKQTSLDVYKKMNKGSIPTYQYEFHGIKKGPRYHEDADIDIDIDTKENKSMLSKCCS